MCSLQHMTVQNHGTSEWECAVPIVLECLQGTRGGGMLNVRGMRLNYHYCYLTLRSYKCY